MDNIGFEIGVGAMTYKSIFTFWIVGMLVISLFVIFISTDNMTSEVQAAAPILRDESAWPSDPDIVFTVYYEDIENDPGSVVLFLDGNEYPMEGNPDEDPVDGQYFSRNVPASIITDDSEFYFYAEDSNGESVNLRSQDLPFLVGDFVGWGEAPVLSNPSVYKDGEWVFNVTYQDPVDGDEAHIVNLVIVGELDDNYIRMETEDLDPLIGQNYIARIPENDANEFTEFYFEADDVEGSYTELYDGEWDYFVVGKLQQSNGDTNGNGDGDGDGDGGGLNLQWLINAFGNPEVVVGVIGLVAIGAGSAYGVYRRKKKHGRFSELLTEMDKIYGSYKTNPKRCELELEKMRSTINEDLKKNTIDENNYAILKGRIDEIIKEIRSETIHSEVKDLPKDIEIKIKDMLIDGEITREEYDKLLPIIKGSDMATDDKERMKKMVESWVKEDKEKGSE
ncbi:MAG: hypothetical protein JSV09_14105 [Thermoplasmata archaeon]|nr:MAG: hypothetical protein JSV09_14105 [Thermoplasmata archaeon]